MLDIAIIGVGLAGIFAARELQAKGFTVELFDKSRGVGGRLATRRGFETRFDHGLPSWENQGLHTEKIIPVLQGKDLIQPWKIAVSDNLDPASWQHLEAKSAYCVPDGMTAIAKYLTQDLTINRSFHLDQLIPQQNSWHLKFKNSERVEAKAVILAIPAPQAIPLTQNFVAKKMGDRLQNIAYEPALSLMLGFEALALDFPWQELRLKNHPIFKKIILDGQKRSPQTQTLVLQTNTNFTQQYLDADDLEPAAKTLIAEIRKILLLSEPLWHQIHRWRYAIPQQILGETHLTLSTNTELLLCGDWCLGHGIEGAINSGLAAAAHFD